MTDIEKEKLKDIITRVYLEGVEAGENRIDWHESRDIGIALYKILRLIEEAGKRGGESMIEDMMKITKDGIEPMDTVVLKNLRCNSADSK